MYSNLFGNCGRLVNTMGIVGGKSCDSFYTADVVNQVIHTARRVKAHINPILSHYLSAQYSTRIFRKIPLIEHYLYPVSTAPTISTTN